MTEDTLAISSLPGFVLPPDVSGSHKYLARDVLTEPIRAVAAQVRVPSRAGSGFDVDAEFVSANTVRSDSFVAD